MRERERDVCVYLCFKTTPLIYYDTVFIKDYKAKKRPGCCPGCPKLSIKTKIVIYSIISILKMYKYSLMEIERLVEGYIIPGTINL